MSWLQHIYRSNVGGNDNVHDYRSVSGTCLRSTAEQSTFGRTKERSRARSVVQNVYSSHSTSRETSFPVGFAVILLHDHAVQLLIARRTRSQASLLRTSGVFHFCRKIHRPGIFQEVFCSPESRKEGTCIVHIPQQVATDYNLVRIAFRVVAYTKYRIRYNEQIHK